MLLNMIIFKVEIVMPMFDKSLAFKNFLGKRKDVYNTRAITNDAIIFMMSKLKIVNVANLSNKKEMPCPIKSESNIAKRERNRTGRRCLKRSRA